MARRLVTVGDLRRYVASLINRVEAKQLDAATAGKLTYMANILKGIVVDSEMEQRLAQTEAKIKQLTEQTKWKGQ